MSPHRLGVIHAGLLKGLKKGSVLSFSKLLCLNQHGQVIAQVLFKNRLGCQGNGRSFERLFYVLVENQRFAHFRDVDIGILKRPDLAGLKRDECRGWCSLIGLNNSLFTHVDSWLDPLPMHGLPKFPRLQITEPRSSGGMPPLEIEQSI